MNILGVGPAEMVAVFLIALVVAGPKRMIAWAYIAGKYVAQFKRMFDETSKAVMAEFNAELGDTELEPLKELAGLRRNRFNILQEASKLLDTELDPADAANPTDMKQTADGIETVAVQSEAER